jgi:hypothetical protein
MPRSSRTASRRSPRRCRARGRRAAAPRSHPGTAPAACRPGHRAPPTAYVNVTITSGPYTVAAAYVCAQHVRAQHRTQRLERMIAMLPGQPAQLGQHRRLLLARGRQVPRDHGRHSPCVDSSSAPYRFGWLTRVPSRGDTPLCGHSPVRQRLRYAGNSDELTRQP